MIGFGIYSSTVKNDYSTTYEKFQQSGFPQTNYSGTRKPDNYKKESVKNYC